MDKEYIDILIFGGSNFWGTSYLLTYIELLGQYQQKIKDIASEMKASSNTFAEYQDDYDALHEDIGKTTSTIDKDVDPIGFDEDILRQNIEKYQKRIKERWEDAKGEGIVTDDLLGGSTENFDKMLDVLSSKSGVITDYAKQLRSEFKNLFPTTEANVVNMSIKSIASTSTVSMHVVKRLLQENGEDTKTWRERMKKAYEAASKSVMQYMLLWNAAKSLKGPESIEATEMEEKVKNAQDLETLLKDLDKIWKFTEAKARRGSGGSKKDPWIEMMENRMKYMQDFHKGVEKLSKVMEYNAAVTQERLIMMQRGVSLDLKPQNLTGSADELIKWYEEAIQEVVAKIKKTNKSLSSNNYNTVESILGFKSTHKTTVALQKLLESLYKALTDFKTDKVSREMEAKLQKLSYEISRTKVAKEFFDKMLGMTGNRELSATLTMSVYGVSDEDLGKALSKQMIDQAQEVFGELDISNAIDMSNLRIDYTILRQYLDTQKALDQEQRKLSKDQIKRAEEFVKAGEKANADWLSNFYKTTQKAASIQERRDKLQTEYGEMLYELTLRDAPQEDFDRLDAYFDKQWSSLNLEEFKESSDYLKIFEDIENLSIPIIDRLIEKIKKLIANNKELNATDLKNLTEQIQKLEEGKVRKSAWFEGVGEGIKEWVTAMNTMRKAKKGTEEYENAVIAANKAHSKVLDGLDALQNEFSQAQQLVNNFANALGVAEDSGFGIFLSGLSDALGAAVQMLSFASLAVKVFDGTIKSFLASNPIGWVVLAVTGILAALQAVANARVKRIDRDIEDLQGTIDDLQYSYEQLEKAQE
jgi:hypothetical protein